MYTDDIPQFEEGDDEPEDRLSQEWSLAEVMKEFGLSVEEARKRMGFSDDIMPREVEIVPRRPPGFLA